MTGTPEPNPFAEQQLHLPVMGPAPGERWRNRNTGTTVAVLAAEQRRHGWVTIRVHGSVQTVRLDNFLRHFEHPHHNPRETG